MRLHRLESMRGGWFVGAFEPSVLRTADFEVGLHRHRAGDPCEPHFHALAAEINLIVRGRMSVNGASLGAGDIFVFEPFEVCEVEFLEDTELVVVKSPSVPADKFGAPSPEARPRT